MSSKSEPFDKYIMLEFRKAVKKAIKDGETNWLASDEAEQLSVAVLAILNGADPYKEFGLSGKPGNKKTLLTKKLHIAETILRNIPDGKVHGKVKATIKKAEEEFFLGFKQIEKIYYDYRGKAQINIDIEFENNRILNSLKNEN